MERRSGIPAAERAYPGGPAAPRGPRAQPLPRCGPVGARRPQRLHPPGREQGAAHGDPGQECGSAAAGTRQRWFAFPPGLSLPGVGSAAPPGSLGCCRAPRTRADVPRPEQGKSGQDPFASSLPHPGFPPVRPSPVTGASPGPFPRGGAEGPGEEGAKRQQRRGRRLLSCLPPPSSVLPGSWRRAGEAGQGGTRGRRVPALGGGPAGERGRRRTDAGQRCH